MTHWNYNPQVHRICNQQLTRIMIYCSLWDYRRLTCPSHTAGPLSIEYDSLTEIKARYYSCCFYLYRLVINKEREHFLRLSYFFFWARSLASVARCTLALVSLCLTFSLRASYNEKQTTSKSTVVFKLNNRMFMALHCLNFQTW